MGECRILKCYRETIPDCCFAGRLYTSADFLEDTINGKWRQWLESGRFQLLTELQTPEFQAAYPEASAYVGLIRGGGGNRLLYGIGMFLPAESPIPQGFDYVYLPHTEICVAWVQGKREDIYHGESAACDCLVEAGCLPRQESDGSALFFERHARPRFTSPDENGEVILDVGFFTK